MRTRSRFAVVFSTRRKSGFVKFINLRARFGSECDVHMRFLRSTFCDPKIRFRSFAKTSNMEIKNLFDPSVKQEIINRINTLHPDSQPQWGKMNVAQMLAHHTVNGCNLQPGDLLGSGTLSGPTLDQAGALIELTTGGKNPVQLPGGEQRVFLEDGDAVVIRGWCEKPGAARVGFGECWGTVLPAL